MTPEQWNESARMFNFEQITVLRNLFRQGISGNLFLRRRQLEIMLKMLLWISRVIW